MESIQGTNLFDDHEIKSITIEEMPPHGYIYFYDAQSGTFLKIEEYAACDVEYFEVLKVDKLLLRCDLFKSVAKVL